MCQADELSTNRSPAVSVLMPVRNGGEGLLRAWRSLVAQTESDWECVLVDDRSDDGALARLPPDPRLRVLACRGRGIVAALNTGLAACRAPLIARMDADDWMHPDRLARQRAAFAADPTLDVLACRVAVERVDGHPAPGMRAYVAWQNALLDHASIAGAFYAESPLAHPSVMIRSRSLRAVGGYRQSPWPEDLDLWLRGLQRGWRFGRLPEVLLHWVDSDGRLTRTDPRCKPEMICAARAWYLSRGPLAGERVLICGGGREAHWLGRGLQQHGVRLEAFVDIDDRRVGGQRLGVPVRGIEALSGPMVQQVVLAVAGRAAREAALKQLVARDVFPLVAA